MSLAGMARCAVPTIYEQCQGHVAPRPGVRTAESSRSLLPFILSFQRCSHPADMAVRAPVRFGHHALKIYPSSEKPVHAASAIRFVIAERTRTSGRRQTRGHHGLRSELHSD